MRIFQYKNVLFLVILVIIDQLLKYIIRLHGGFYICNRGAAFGLPFLTLLSIILGIILLFYLLNFKSIFRQRRISPWMTNFKFQISNCSRITIFSIILIVSGGLSNAIDRIIFGCVIDFIDLRFWPVFNLADTCITIGAIILVIKLWKKY